MDLCIFVDGGSRGNPGPSGAGIAIYDKQSSASIWEAGVFLGRLTNNVAEYRGLIRALEEAIKLKPTSVEINSDSQLMIRQLQGDYRVKAPQLKPLFDKAVALLRQLDNVTLRHVLRGQNQRADELANLAMDNGRDVEVASIKPFLAGGKVAVSPATPSPEAVGFIAEIQAAAGTACPAGQRKARYVFSATIPAGMCVHAARAALDAALPPGDASGSTRCDHCGAAIQLTRG